MSDDTKTVIEPDTPESGKGLRSKLEEALAEVKQLKAEKMVGEFKEAGLDPTKGLGKAIAKEYDGEISKEAIQEYARSEYDWEPPVVEEPNPVAQAIAQEQAALDQAGRTAGSVVQPNQADLLAKAEAEGDYQATMNIKGQQVAQMFQNP